jgi:hypothetical protein
MSNLIDPAKLDTETAEWLASSPEKVRDAFLACPPGLYLVKIGAPYILSAPGCKVVVHGHTGGGLAIITVVEPTAEAIANVKARAVEYGVQPISIDELKMHVEPEWLELIELAPDLKVAKL